MHLARLSRLMGVVAVVALFGIGMCGFLSYFKFRSAIEAAARSSMAVPATSVRQGIEAALALGVPLAGASEAPALLARERQADATIAEISVFDAQGQVLFSTAATRVGQPVPADWLQRAASGQDWHLDLDDTNESVLGLPLRNSFDLRLGEVAVRYSLTPTQQALAQMRRQLLWIGIVGWTLTMLLAGTALAAVQRFSAPRVAAA